MAPLLQGFAIGFAVAAPVGPIGLLCIRRSILDGRLTGFVTGLGAAFGDAIYGLVAALGLTSVTGFVGHHGPACELAGGLCLLVLGLAMARSRPRPRPAGTVHAPNLTAAFASAAAITLANPMTVAAFLGIFTGLGPGLTASGIAPVSWLVLGVFLGSAAWWLILSGCASWFGRNISDERLHLFNLTAGLAIAAFGVWQLVRAGARLI